MVLPTRTLTSSQPSQPALPQSIPDKVLCCPVPGTPNTYSIPDCSWNTPPMDHTMSFLRELRRRSKASSPNPDNNKPIGNGDSPSANSSLLSPDASSYSSVTPPSPFNESSQSTANGSASVPSLNLPPQRSATLTAHSLPQRSVTRVREKIMMI